MEDNCLIEKIDTILNADSVEFCPYEGDENVLLCGTYKLQEEVSPQTVAEDSGEPKSKPPASQIRLGGVTVFCLACLDGCPRLNNQSRLDLCGVLDIKWPASQMDNRSVFGLVDAEGFFQVFALSKEGGPPSLITKHSLSPTSLGLSLAWDGGGQRLSSKAVCSDSTGCLTVFDFASDSPSQLSQWKAHDYEAWIAAFHDFDSNLVYSGGDDCRLKGWDIRDTTTPTFVSRRHSMGVCSIQSHPFLEHIYATGSYDEELLVWDRRSQKHPLSSVGLGGGVWRVKWDPADGQHVLTATMYNGTHIVHADPRSSNPPSIVAYHGDHNLAYGADWCRLDKNLVRIHSHHDDDDREVTSPEWLISTCSFYDHSLHLWGWSSGVR